MRKHKIISQLNYYYKIQAATFKEDDHITESLINNYEKLVLATNSQDDAQVPKIIKLDQIVYEYLTNNDYKIMFLDKVNIFETSDEQELNRFLEDVLMFDIHYQQSFYNTRVGSWI